MRNDDGRKRKKSWRRSWRAASSLKKLEIIIAGFVAVGGIGYLISYIVVSVHENSVAQMEDRPRVIVSRPPELLGTIACNVTAKAIHFFTGPMRIWVKNTGRGDAIDSFLYVPQLKLVPDKKTGTPDIDEIPSISDKTCQLKVPPSSKMFPIYEGQEISVNITQFVGAQSLINTKNLSVTLGGPQPEPQTPAGENPEPIHVDKDAAFQLYAPICVYYSDRNGISYGSCRTYRLNIGTVLEGPYSFSCTRTPITGSFEATFGNYCDN